MDEFEELYNNLAYYQDLSVDLLKSVLQDYKGGSTAFNIYKKYNLKSPSVVYIITNKYKEITGKSLREPKVQRIESADEIKQEGIKERFEKMKRKYKLSDEEIEKMVSDYNNGMSAFKISKNYGLDGSSHVYAILKKAEEVKGLSVRKKGKIMANEESEKTVVFSVSDFEKTIPIYVLNKKYNIGVDILSDSFGFDSEEIKNKIDYIDRVKKVTDGLKQDGYNNNQIIEIFDKKYINLTEKNISMLEDIDKKDNKDINER